jgi:hypothetical protein
MRLASLLAVGVFAATACAQSTLVSPNGFATTEGSSNNAYPWNRANQSTRIQFIYDSTNFTAQTVAFPITITQLRFRADNPGTTSWTGGSWPNVRIDMASCPFDYTAASGTFASNLGPDLLTVLNGPVTVAAGSTSGGTAPGPWYITIPLTTPFLYDPSLGSDLVIDIYEDGTGWTGASTQCDHTSGATPSPALGTRVYNVAAGALTATSGTVGVNYDAIVEFTYVTGTGYAQSSSYGAGCINQPDVSTYELFPTAASFDLASTAISLVRTPDGYLALPGFTTYVPPSGAATSLALGDDTEVTVPLTGTMPVGRTSTTNQLTVCSNGFISPASGNGVSFSPIASTFLNSGQMWWSLGWHDFNPSIAGSGQVKFEQVGGIAYVTWDGVWDFSGTSAANASTMQAQFDVATGNVHFVYQTMSIAGGTGFLVGVSDAGPSADPGSMNISAALPGTYNAEVFAQTGIAHAASARPVLGTTINLVTSNVPAAGLIGIDILGTTQFSPGIDLTPLGMPTCNLYTSLDATPSVALVAGSCSLTLPIPNSPGLAGALIYSQGAAFVPGINPFGFLTSNGVRLKLDVN